MEPDGRLAMLQPAGVILFNRGSTARQIPPEVVFYVCCREDSEFIVAPVRPIQKCSVARLRGRDASG